MSNNDKKINQSNTKAPPEKESLQGPKIWNESEVNLLKKWAELSGSYRVLHDRAHRKYKHLNYCATIPVIIFSTVLGTASFSQTTFPKEYQSYIPMGIGTLNIISGIITTVAQFTRVSELSEANRVASISYGKFSRNIATELALPPEFRSYSGIDFVQICRSEFDRLVEQSPIIPIEILTTYMTEIENENITKPDIMTATRIEEYKPTKEEKAAKIIASAFQTMHNRKKDMEKTGVQRMAELVQKKGYQMVDRIQKAITPPPKPEMVAPNLIEMKERALGRANEIRHDFREAKVSSFQRGEHDIENQMEEEVEKQVENTKKAFTGFVGKQVESRTNELKNISGSGLVANLIKKKESFKNTPTTTPVKNMVQSVSQGISQNISQPLAEQNMKSNIMNIIHRAKHDLEEHVEEIKSDIENQIPPPDTSS
jgi:alpha-acetolactate decarboxylase